MDRFPFAAVDAPKSDRLLESVQRVTAHAQQREQHQQRACTRGLNGCRSALADTASSRSQTVKQPAIACEASAVQPNSGGARGTEGEERSGRVPPASGVDG
jgi:hypothetical protein